MTYAVLDPAREPALYEHIARLEPGAAACLFEGRLAPELKQVSPHLVELAPNDPLAAAWRREGWGKSWGIQLDSAKPLGFVRRRLRHFTQARLPDGEGPVLFRFWDPRVFRVYLPLVEPAELPAWFEGIECYRCEGEDSSILEFRLAGTTLQTSVSPRLSP